MTNTIDNSNLINMCRDCGAGNFLPHVAYTYDAAAATVAINDTTTYNSGGARKKVKVKVHDFFGGQVSAEMAAADADHIITVDVSTLNRAKQLALCVTIITDDKIIADGGAYGLMAAGDVAHWDVQKTSA